MRPGHRLSATLVAVLLCLVTFGVALPVRGEDDPNERLFQKSDDELREEGWEVRGQDRAPGSVGCGLWAVAVSTVWHGWGHRCAGDNDSHYALLAMEGVAVGLVAAAVTIAVVSNDADTLNPVWHALFFAGSTLFVSGYGFDLLGTIKGSSRELYDNQRDVDGLRPRLFTRLVFVDPYDLNAVFGLDVALRYGILRFVPEARLDVTGGKYWALGGDLGFKLWRGDSRATYVALGAESRFEAFDSMGFEVLMAAPYVELGLDVGVLLPHLKGLHFVNRVGYGFEFYRWDAVPSADLFKDRSSLFILESELGLNLLENVNLAVLYQQRPDMLVGGLAPSGQIFDAIPHPGVGIFGFDLEFETENGWRGDFRVNLGTLVEFWLGFARRF